MKVKICGLTTPETVDAAVAAGAFALGFMFHPKSPRNIGIEQAAALMRRVPADRLCVGVMVDPEDDLIDAIRKSCAMTALQLHGDETPQRVAALAAGAAAGLRTIKVIPVRTADDVRGARAFTGVAAMTLFDAKTPEGSPIPGGMGMRFDWRLIPENHDGTPFGVAGGLDAANIAECIHVTRADFLDVSSGVESAPGVKDMDKIAAFLKAAQAS